VQVFGGQLGGPMAGLAPLVGEMLGVERAAFEMEDVSSISKSIASPTLALCRTPSLR
jgi:hypothetical protein